MLKTLIKSFSALILFASLFYSCGEQSVQPPYSKAAPGQVTIFEKLGLVQIVSSENIFLKTVDFNTGELNTAGFKKIRISFKSESNCFGSTVRLFLHSPGIKNQGIFTINIQGENNQGTDHSIDIEDPAEKIWLSMNIKLETYNSGDENYIYTKVSDLVIYGIR
jgi:hypothetical protein